MLGDGRPPGPDHVPRTAALARRVGRVTLGLVLGLVFCLNIASIQHFLEGLLGVQLFNSDVYMLDAIPALVDPVDVIWITVWATFMSCVASLIPSWLATRIDPIEALRYE